MYTFKLLRSSTNLKCVLYRYVAKRGHYNFVPTLPFKYMYYTYYKWVHANMCMYKILIFKIVHSKVQAICYTKASILKTKNRKMLSIMPSYRLQT